MGFLMVGLYNTYTQFYNHGPIRSYALYFLAILLDKMVLPDMFSFHIAVVSFLAISDALISVLLWRLFGRLPAIIFLLNPVSLLITGFHSQIETVPIMFGFFSWYFFLKAQDIWKKKSRKIK